jgi:hypothetical protein
MALLVRGLELRGIILPDVNAPEAAVVDNTKVLGMHNLPVVISFPRGEKTVEPFVIDLDNERTFGLWRGLLKGKRPGTLKEGPLRLLRQEGIMFWWHGHNIAVIRGFHFIIYRDNTLHSQCEIKESQRGEEGNHCYCKESNNTNAKNIFKWWAVCSGNGSIRVS